MRKILFALVAAGTMSAFGIPNSFAGAVNGGASVDFGKIASPVQDVRVYCYNTYTGRFLHWGRCGYRYHYRRHRYYRHYRYYRYY